MMKPSLLAPLLSASFFSPSPPPAERAVKDFELQGSAVVHGDRCVRLTPDARFARGAAWSRAGLELAKPFDIELSLGFGTNDVLGADGIVFALTTQPQLGWWGEWMGSRRGMSAILVELDTYQNSRQSDPAADHLSLRVHSPTSGPSEDGRLVLVRALPPVELPNLEDGRLHPFRVQWTPEGGLKVSLDGEVRATLPAKELRAAFGPRSVVSWGLTAATGRKTNAHDVCLPTQVLAHR